MMSSMGLPRAEADELLRAHPELCPSADHRLDDYFSGPVATTCELCRASIVGVARNMLFVNGKWPTRKRTWVYRTICEACAEN